MAAKAADRTCRRWKVAVKLTSALDREAMDSKWELGTQRRRKFAVAALIGAVVWIALVGASSAGQPRTVEGVVDGQKYGTNVRGDSASVTFEGDSKEEARLLDACDVGERCKVVVVTRTGDVVARLISAERMRSAPVLAGVGAVPAAVASGPAFSCEKAATHVERTICSDASLSALDRKLATVFRSRLEANPTRRKLIQQQQREWIATVRAACKDAECLRGVYKDRISALSR